MDDKHASLENQLEYRRIKPLSLEPVYSIAKLPKILFFKKIGFFTTT